MCFLVRVGMEVVLESFFFVVSWLGLRGGLHSCSRRGQGSRPAIAPVLCGVAGAGECDGDRGGEARWRRSVGFMIKAAN